MWLYFDFWEIICFRKILRSLIVFDGKSLIETVYFLVQRKIFSLIIESYTKLPALDTYLKNQYISSAWFLWDLAAQKKNKLLTDFWFVRTSWHQTGLLCPDFNQRKKSRSNNIYYFTWLIYLCKIYRYSYFKNWYE